MAGAFFQAVPAAGGFSQTLVNVGAGARTQVSGLVTAAVAVLVALFLAPVLSDLPEATLASVVLVAVIGLIDVGVERNAYGRQRESYEAEGRATLEGRTVPLPMMFIRAPRIRRVGPGVETLGRHGDEPVMAREGHVLVATFHPELTADTTVHRYFCQMVERATAARGVATSAARGG